MNSRTYEVGQSKITLLFGDLTTSKAEVLVSSDDYLLSMGGGVSAAIRRAGGSRVAADASKLVPASTGEVVVSTAGDLAAKYIFHAVTIGPKKVDLSQEAIVRQTTQRALRLLPLLGCKSIAFPAIGAGVARIPLGMRYGYVDPGTGLSMTELEYRQAIANDRKIFMFVMDQNAPIIAGMVEDDPIRYAKLIDFRSRVMKGHTCSLFTDPKDLAQKVEASLRETLQVTA